LNNPTLFGWFFEIFVKQQGMQKQIGMSLQHWGHWHFPPKTVCGSVALGHAPNLKLAEMGSLQEHLMSLTAASLNFANLSVGIANIVVLCQTTES